MKEIFGIYGKIKRTIKNSKKSYNSLSYSEKSPFELVQYYQHFKSVYVDGSGMASKIKNIPELFCFKVDTLPMQAKYHSHKLKAVKRVC